MELVFIKLHDFLVVLIDRRAALKEVKKCFATSVKKKKKKGQVGTRVRNTQGFKFSFTPYLED